MAYQIPLHLDKIHKTASERISLLAKDIQQRRDRTLMIFNGWLTSYVRQQLNLKEICQFLQIIL